MNVNKTKPLKVGLFTLMGLLLIVGYTVLVNNRPFWWRSCNYKEIRIEDATGLKSKAPVRSLGIEIGYLKTVRLSETHVTLGICITAPVKTLESTRAYIRGEGFLGDRFVELKPVQYVGDVEESSSQEVKGIRFETSFVQLQSLFVTGLTKVLDWTIPSAHAVNETKPVIDNSSLKKRNNSEIPVGDSGDVDNVVEKVDDLVEQMTQLTDNLKSTFNPQDMQRTMRQLNQTLENASKTLAPEGGLTQTAQRSLAKLEDAIEQLRDLMTRVNRGEGSVGMLMNDPKYADEIHEAIRNINRLLSKVDGVRFHLDVFGGVLTGYDGGRGGVHVGIWPTPSRYYLLGISSDSRGRIVNLTTRTTAGGQTQTTQTFSTETTGILISAMLGKVFWNRVDLSIGARYGDAALSIGLKLGPREREDMFVLRNDIYSRVAGTALDDRITLQVQPFSGVMKSLYVNAGLESIRGYNGTKQPIVYYGAGVSFDDEDIKVLFALL